MKTVRYHEHNISVATQSRCHHSQVCANSFAQTVPIESSKCTRQILSRFPVHFSRIFRRTSLGVGALLSYRWYENEKRPLWLANRTTERYARKVCHTWPQFATNPRRHHATKLKQCIAKQCRAKDLSPGIGCSSRNPAVTQSNCRPTSRSWSGRPVRIHRLRDCEPVYERGYRCYLIAFFNRAEATAPAGVRSVQNGFLGDCVF